ncbi:unnamed protein product [Ectocarpus sp. 4 AP-2014]
MHSSTNEGSPLLQGVAAGSMGDWNDVNRQGSGRALLGETSKSKRRSRQQPGASARSGGASPSFRSKWRVSAGVAGVLMFSMALAGLVAIFSTIQRERTPRSASPSQQEQGVSLTPPEAARDVREPVDIQVDEEEEGEGKGGEPNPQAETAKPNVFFIMVDDMGWNDIGYQSVDLQGVTPHLDRLAAGGVKMTNYYTMSICTPARASLMTGRYVIRYGLQYSVIQPGAPWGLPLTEKIFPEYMKDAGYETHMIGKWHIGSYTSRHVPSQRGFDTYLGYLNDEEMYWTHQSWTAKYNGRKFFDFGFGNATGYYDIIDRELPDHLREGTVSDGDDDETMLSPTSSYSSSGGFFKGRYSTQVFHNRALEIIHEKTPYDDEPLYMYLSHQAVHDPLGLPPGDQFTQDQLDLLERIETGSEEGTGTLRARFAKVLMYLDYTIGELVEYLETNGWMENSIIIVASDNGGCPSCGGSNYPLRGIKHSYWEGGTKVPSFVYSKSHIPEERWGTEYDGLMHVTDWLPTIAGAAEIDLDGGAGPFDGVDQWPLITSVAAEAEFGSARDEMMYNFDPYILWVDSSDSIGDPEFNLAQGAFRSGKYKYLANEWCTGWFTFDKHILAEDPLTNLTLACDGSPCSDCGQGCTSYNYTDYLFDLEADPREENNLIYDLPDVAHNMRERWVEVAFSDWGNSSYENIDHQAYYVWASFNWWMVPWWHLVGSTSSESATSSTSSSS